MESQTIGTQSAVAVDDNKQEHALKLLDLLLIFARRKRLIAGVTVGAAIAAAAVSLLLPNWYTATTTILPPQQNVSLTASLVGQLGGLSPLTSAGTAAQSLGLKNPNEIYVSMLRSRTVADAMIQRFDLMKVYRARTMPDARKELQKASGMDLSSRDSTITIAVEDRDRKRAAEMANAYVEELRAVTQIHAVSEAAQRRMFFERQMAQAKNNLASAEQALKETQQKTGLIQLNDQSRAIIESVVKLRAEIAAKEVQVQVLRSGATERNPDLIRLEQELAGMRTQLASVERQSGGGGGDIQVATGKVPEAGLEYARRVRDVKYYETVFELLAKQYEAAQLDESRTSAVIEVLDPATSPDKKSSPKRAVIVLVSAFMALFACCAYVLFEDAVRCAQQDPERTAQIKFLRTSISRW